MAKRKRKSTIKTHQFRNKLLLNQWLMSLFGIDPLREGAKKRPFHKLAEPIRDPRLEGLDKDNLHHFFHHLTRSPLFSYAGVDTGTLQLSREQLLVYEENIVRHTQAINAKRHRPVVWKYYQWLSLLFVEIYLDRYFSDRESLLAALNEYVDRFNRRHTEYADMDTFNEDELNKLSLQNATGSGKTLLMHVNYLQYEHYSKKYGKENDLSKAILISPNERLSEQHIAEFSESNIHAFRLEKARITTAQIDVVEITKLGDKEGPNTIATRSLGDQNLLLVDEGHRGLSGINAKADENAWFKNRAMLCEK
ncbi:MAG: DEAD/DEAH box helicase, partial [Flavobacteriaceae bacterium]|nr:DEAD/DEAH box helicase [Flavobacteriaceae bacterium]